MTLLISYKIYFKSIIITRDTREIYNKMVSIIKYIETANIHGHLASEY